MRNILLFILLYLVFGCDSSSNKKDYKFTAKVCEHLHVELFTTFGSGAFGGDMVSNYLTDSTNFRILIGKYDNNKEAYSYECREDSVIVERFNIVREDSKKIVTEVKVFSLEMLRKEHKFE